MTKRVVISIGCNAYEHISALQGAENDAKQIYEALLDPSKGEYDAKLSRLLISPTLAELRAEILAIISGSSEIDTLTIFFAGHAGVNNGTLYLATRDSIPNLLFGTAYSLEELFRLVSEVRPRETNLIIDACEGGGVASDISQLLKAENLGSAGTPGVTILATATADQFAEETKKGGIGTNAILDCINGKLEVSNSSRTIDLIDIAKAILPIVSASSKQTPVVWGLNLIGASSFCKNPRIHDEFEMPRSFAGELSAPEAYELVRPYINPLWRVYLDLDEKWEPGEYYRRLRSIIEQLGKNPQHQSAFVERMTLSAAERSRANPDRFAVVEVLAIGAIALLPLIETNASAKATAERLLKATYNEAFVALEALSIMIKDKPLCLITGASADYFYLPIRITRVMAWIGYLFIAEVNVEPLLRDRRAFLYGLQQDIFTLYSTALTAMSDLQAPYLAITARHFLNANMTDELEELLGYFLNSLARDKGIVASNHLDGESAFEFLFRRATGKLKPGCEFIAQPSELIAVCMRLAALAGLSDLFDFMAVDLDHIVANVFVPDNWRDFGDEAIEHGVNHSFQIGHGIWTTKDFEAIWPEEKIAPPENALIGSACILASLIFPNRVPWFILKSKQQ